MERKIINRTAKIINRKFSDWESPLWIKKGINNLTTKKEAIRSRPNKKKVNRKALNNATINRSNKEEWITTIN